MPAGVRQSHGGASHKHVADVHYGSTLRFCAIGSSVACVLFITALCVAIGPAFDWALNYERTTCLINNVSTTSEVECEIPQGEKLDSNDQGLFVVPCVQINVAYTNASGSDRVCDIAMPRRAVLLAEYSAGSSQRLYNPGDYAGEPLPGPDGRINAQRTSILTRALFTTRTCTFLDCRRDRDEAVEVVRAIAARYVPGTRIPCFVYKPKQVEADLSALVVLNQVQTDTEVLAWTVTTLLAVVCTCPACVFLCCREWLCRCPPSVRKYQYF